MSRARLHDRLVILGRGRQYADILDSRRPRVACTECHRRNRIARHDVGPSLVLPERRKERMSGTKRLPGGERRKASQRNRPARAAPSQVQIAWRAGDPVKWKDRTGLFRREVGDNEHAEIAIAERVYRVKLSELG